MSFPGSVLLQNGEWLTQSATKKLPLGTQGYTLDGRCFRYCKNGGTALSPGVFVQGYPTDTAFEEQELADSTDWAVPTTGSTLIRLSTDTSMTTNDGMADGYLFVTAGATGDTIGQMVQILSSPITTATAAPANCPEIFLYSEDKLTAALTTANTVTLVRNKYSGTVVCVDGAPTAVPIGLTPRAISANYYYWAQTKGMACARVSDTWDVGRAVIIASATGTVAGEGHPVSSLEADAGAAVVGLSVYIGTDGYCGVVDLNID